MTHTELPPLINETTSLSGRGSHQPQKEWKTTNKNKRSYLPTVMLCLVALCLMVIYTSNSNSTTSSITALTTRTVNTAALLRGNNVKDDDTDKNKDKNKDTDNDTDNDTDKDTENKSATNPDDDAKKVETEDKGTKQKDKPSTAPIDGPALPSKKKKKEGKPKNSTSSTPPTEKKNDAKNVETEDTSSKQKDKPATAPPTLQDAVHPVLTDAVHPVLNKVDDKKEKEDKAAPKSDHEKHEKKKEDTPKKKKKKKKEDTPQEDAVVPAAPPSKKKKKKEDTPKDSTTSSTPPTEKKKHTPVGPPAGCTREFDPVICGGDDYTFNNPCLAEEAGYHVETQCFREQRPDGHHDDDEDDDDDDDDDDYYYVDGCTRELDPVICGGDDYTFNNPCLAEEAGYHVETQCFREQRPGHHDDDDDDDDYYYVNDEGCGPGFEWCVSLNRCSSLSGPCFPVLGAGQCRKRGITWCASLNHCINPLRRVCPPSNGNDDGMMPASHFDTDDLRERPGGWNSGYMEGPIGNDGMWPVVNPDIHFMNVHPDIHFMDVHPDIHFMDTNPDIHFMDTNPDIPYFMDPFDEAPMGGTLVQV